MKQRTPSGDGAKKQITGRLNTPIPNHHYKRANANKQTTNTQPSLEGQTETNTFLKKCTDFYVNTLHGFQA
jgi:hypothetical protein